jgi:formamidopyrimidine-DNA glycosylase
MRFAQIGEAARLVNRLRPRVVGHTIKEVKIAPTVTSRLKTPAADLKHMEGRKVEAVNQWGKQFW